MVGAAALRTLFLNRFLRVFYGLYVFLHFLLFVFDNLENKIKPNNSFVRSKFNII
jgi:hypothetical protein